MRAFALPVAAVACLSACPSSVPDDARFAAADAAGGTGVGALGDAAGTPGTDAAGVRADGGGVADAPSGLDGPAAADSMSKSDGPSQSDTTVASDAVAPPDAGCEKNGCAPGPDLCKPSACQPDGSCKATAAPDGTACGAPKTCLAGFCLAPPPAILQLAAGGYTTAARLADGTLRSWGDSASGQLGDGSSGSGKKSASPVTVKAVANAADVACGETHCCAIAGAAALCWGTNEWGAIDPKLATKGVVTTASQVAGVVGAVQVAAGTQFSCARLESGKVRCWGLGSAGQLGDGNGFATKTVTDVSLTEPAVEVRAGHHFACARTAQAKVWCWGSNEYGQLGNGDGGTSKGSLVPVQVAGLTDAVSVATGADHACAAKKDGSAWCWGRNADGAALGAGPGNTYSSTPKQVVGLVDAILVAAGGAHGCAVRKGGSLVCWGRNDHGQLGAVQPASSNQPILVAGLSGLVGVVAGESHTCAWAAAGAGAASGPNKAWCWGSNGFGEAGSGGGKDVTTPGPVLQ